MHKVLTVIALPVLNDDGAATGETIRKEPGSTVTKAEWAKAGQTDEDIQNMLDAGSISEDMDAELHPNHRPVPAGTTSLGQMVESARQMVELMGEENVPAEIKKLAKLDYNHVGAVPETATGGDARADS
jgi:hypothetical protein